ncbi:hypothetical protein JQ594_36290 [Bradyrhizobium manausense]|nr:PEP-CTERM sorting domain-containing protein [Bradyrhizobium manausense]MBR0691421.1 hypothetical protein [Bradyrhizobium manausense]
MSVLILVASIADPPRRATASTSRTPLRRVSTPLLAGYTALRSRGGVTYLYFDNVSLNVTAAVPEASTWAMIILGFAGVSFLAHRRQREGTLNAA